VNAPDRRWFRTAGAVAGGAALVVVGAGPAAAHVTVSSDQPTAGSSALLTFGLSHGCAGSATTGLAIKIPDGINSVAPTVSAGWTVRKVSEKLAAPVTDQHGTTLTSRVDEVIYAAKTPLADGYRDSVVLQVPLPEDSAGKTLAFPVVQSCEKGETAWVELAAEGQDVHDLEAPAPTITVGALAAADDHHAASDAQPAPGSDGAATVTAPGGPTTRTLAVAGLVAGLAGLAAGLFALVRGRLTSR
jgi:uncharacterized protein YcnI